VFQALTSSQTRREDVERSAADAFRFLTEDFGFAHHTRVFGYGTVFEYVRDDCFVEVELDFRDSVASVLVGESRDGRIPDGYYLDTSGRKARWHIGEVLPGNESASLRETTIQLHRRRRPRLDAMLEEIQVLSRTLGEVAPDLPGRLSALRESS
jgi:hypothetical protein